jgi:hypothetical protein
MCACLVVQLVRSGSEGVFGSMYSCPKVDAMVTMTVNPDPTGWQAEAAASLRGDGEKMPMRAVADLGN